MYIMLKWCIVNVRFLRGFILIGLNKINLDFILFWFNMRIKNIMLKSFFFFLNWYKIMFVKYIYNIFILKKKIKKEYVRVNMVYISFLKGESLKIFIRNMYMYLV